MWKESYKDKYKWFLDEIEEILIDKGCLISDYDNPEVGMTREEAILYCLREEKNS